MNHSDRGTASSRQNTDARGELRESPRAVTSPWSSSSTTQGAVASRTRTIAAASAEGHAAARRGITPSQLMIEHLETTRHNTPTTRNVRLAAIKSFMRFVEYRVPAALDQVRCILAIPIKRTNTRLVVHLTRVEMQAVLDAPDPRTREGVRDRAMLHVACAAGLRVSELVGLRLDGLVFEPRLSIRVLGRPRARAVGVARCRGSRPWCAGYGLASPALQRSRDLASAEACHPLTKRPHDHAHAP